MKKHLFTLIYILIGNVNSYATTTYSVGASRDYSTIAAAYAVCTGSTDYVIEIYTDYDFSGEVTLGPITLGSLPLKTSSNTVTIRPASGQTLSFSFLGTATSNSFFKLDGANWVIFDGRAGGSGASAWTIVNTSTSPSRRIFTFINDASNNVLKYCVLKGGITSTSIASSGLVFFSTAGSGSGNDNNTIEHCTLRENVNTAFPSVLIYSAGTSGKTNSGNTVSNCELLNFKYSAIWLNTESDSWVITSNHIYEDQAIGTTGAFQMIHINSGSGYTISENYLGGRAINCGGTSFTRSISTVLNSLSNFSAIYFSANTTAGTINTISGNTIANLNISNSLYTSGDPSFSLIHTSGAGDFIIGSSSNGNIIGASSGTGNITLTYNNMSGYYNSEFNAIYINSMGTSSTTEYNEIGSITYAQSANIQEADDVTLIRVVSTSSVTIRNNTIGNTTANNITMTSQSIRLIGIGTDVSVDYFSPSSLTINDNTIQNLAVLDDPGATMTKLYGIYVSGIETPVNIYGNIVKSLTSSISNPDGNGFNLDAVVTGIYTASTGAGHTLNIYDNKIQSLVNSTATATQVNVIGICASSGSTGASTNIYRNRIKTLSNASTNSASSLVGIAMYFYAGSDPVLHNNVIILSDGSNTVSKKLVGIEIMGDNYPTIKTYYNTVKLEASYSSGSGITAALMAHPSTTLFDIRNNIFQNLSSGGSGDHYAQFWSLNQIYGWTQNHNYNEAPDALKLTNYNGTDYDISAWRTEISDGANSELTGSITVSSTTGVITPSGSVIENAGTPIAGITTDYDLNPRNASNPWMGAFETITPLPIELLSISAKCQKTKTSNSEYGATIQWTTATEKNSYYYLVEGSTDGFVWEVKDTIEAAGTKYDPTSYYYHDDFINPTPENETVVYYRVSQTDFDGVMKTYDILSCKCEASDKIKIHPVPATEYIVINFGDQNNVPNSFQITDMFGRVIEDIVISGGKEGNTSYKLDVQQYASGRYIIKINDWKMKEDAVFIKE